MEGFPDVQVSSGSQVPDSVTEMILGLRFFTGSAEAALNCLKEKGGLLVAPSAPTLLGLRTDAIYRESVLGADVVLPDSGYMILLARLMLGSRLQRLSGLAFVKELLYYRHFYQSRRTFWVMPSVESEKCTRKWLVNRGLHVSAANTYVAPIYNPKNIGDDQLLQIIVQTHPQYIVINLGGGVQEQLGYYLKKHLDYKPAIICTGAALAFLTGEQANIPSWADRWYLGWLMRILSRPSSYLPRYMKSFSLFFLLLRFRRGLPTLKIDHRTR